MKNILQPKGLKIFFRTKLIEEERKIELPLGRHQKYIVERTAPNDRTKGTKIDLQEKRSEDKREKAS